MPYRNHFTIAVLLVCIALSSPNGNAFGAENDISRSKSKLDEVTSEIKKKKQQLNKVEQKEAQVISRLNSIEKLLDAQNREYHDVSIKIDSIQNEIRETRTAIDHLTRESQTKEAHLSRRLTALYKYYRRSGIRILLSAETYNDFLHHERALETIIARDHHLFQDCNHRLREKQLLNERLESQKTALEQEKRRFARKRDEIKGTHKDKVAFLKQIKREKQLQLNALQELEEYSRELQSLIEKLPGTRQTYTSSGKPFSALSGKLDFPVQGPVITHFGKKEHPELRTFTFQKGIEIRAAKGAEIKAVHDGRVVFADWFKGYGYMIIIDHGESYYTLSAHASKLFKQVNDVVRGGETIALVGDTSSIKGDCLYFEIRHHGKPQNPLKWLRKGSNNS